MAWTLQDQTASAVPRNDQFGNLVNPTDADWASMDATTRAHFTDTVRSLATRSSLANLTADQARALGIGVDQNGIVYGSSPNDRSSFSGYRLPDNPYVRAALAGMNDPAYKSYYSSFAAVGQVDPNISAAQLAGKDLSGTSLYAPPKAPTISPITNPIQAPNPGSVGTPSPTLPGLVGPTSTSNFVTVAQTNLASARAALEASYASQLKSITDQKTAAEQKVTDLTTLEQHGVLDNVRDITAPWRATLESSKEQELSVTKNFQENQKLVDELDSLLTEGNQLIAEQKATTGLAAIRDPRVAKTMSDVTARAGVIQAVMAARNSQITVAENLIDRAVAATAADKQDQLNYYKTLLDFYEGQKTDARAKVASLTADQQTYLKAQVGLLENDLSQAQKNADYIKGLMQNPETALTIAQAGITLNDTPDVVNMKLAKQEYTESRNKTINDFTIKGYSYMTTTAQASQHPADQLYTVYDAKGVPMTFWKDPSKTTSGETKQADIASMGQSMQIKAGGVGKFLVPYDYSLAKQQWVSAGYSAKEFDDIFSIYRDPSNSNYQLSY